MDRKAYRSGNSNSQIHKTLMKQDWIFNTLLLMLLPSLVISFAANSIILGALSVISIFQISRSTAKTYLRKYLYFVSFFLAVLLGLFLDVLSGTDFDSRQIIKRAAFILMPFIILHAKKHYQRLAVQIFIYFLSSLSFILILIGFVRSVINKNKVLYGNWDSKTTEAFYQQDMIINWGELSYKRLFLFLDMHPSYYAFFSATAILILLFTNCLRIKNPIKWLLVTLHAIMIVLLSSKAGLASLFIILISAFFLNKDLSYKLMGTVVILILIISIMSIPSTQLRLKRAYASLTSENTELQSSSSSERMILWGSLKDFSAQELLTGVGIQSSRSKINLLTGIDKNMHNQYLQVLVNSGVAGCILLISFLLLPLAYNRSLFTKMFIAVLLLNLMIENMLDRAWGVVFVSFFYALFIFGDLNFSNEKSLKIEN